METVVDGVELSLPHQSLGDKYIALISDVVKDLPNVTRLDLRDNRLTDVGVQEIVEAICSIEDHRGIEVTDCSNILQNTCEVSIRFKMHTKRPSTLHAPHFAPKIAPR